MHPLELIKNAVRVVFPDAEIGLSRQSNLLVLTVRRSWGRLPQHERQARVYNALETLPLELLARITAINTPDGESHVR